MSQVPNEPTLDLPDPHPAAPPGSWAHRIKEAMEARLPAWVRALLADLEERQSGTFAAPTGQGGRLQVDAVDVTPAQVGAQPAGDYATREAMAVADAATLDAARDYTDRALAEYAPTEDLTLRTVGGVAWYEAGATNPDSYAALGPLMEDAGALAGNTGYDRDGSNPAAIHIQARMRRCVLADDGATVVYYLDADDSRLRAGAWLRIHEGAHDPVRPIPGQAATGNPALRRGVKAWDPNVTYTKGTWVLHNGSVWESLQDANLGNTPAPGVTAANLDGTDGQVMVEVPRFYTAYRYSPSLRRHAWDAALNPDEVRPYPDLLADLSDDLPTNRTINGITYTVHPAFTKGGKQRSHRYLNAFSVTATDVGNNTSGTLRSVSDGETVQTTSIGRQNFRAKARNRNTGLADPSGQANNVWHVLDWALWEAVQLLFLLEYRTFHSQAVLGGGNITGSAYQKIAGRSAPCGNASGVFDATGALQTPTEGTFDGMTYRGIEDLWGSAWTRVDGWNVQHDSQGPKHWRSLDPASFADNTSAGYELVAATPVRTDSYYPTGLTAGTLLASELGGSSATYVPDYYITQPDTYTGWLSPLLGGAANGGSTAGLFMASVYSAATSAAVNFGAALAR